MAKFKPLIVCLLLAIITAAALVARDNSKLPKLPAKRPADLKITYQYSVGMLPINSRVFLSESESYTENLEYGASRRVNFTVAPGDLDSLYAIFHDRHFERIVSRREQVYDAGAGSISISWGDTFVNQNIGDDVVMNQKDAATMNLIQQELFKLTKSRTDTLRVPLTVTADQSIKNLDRLSFEINGSSSYTFTANARAPRVINLTELPGEYNFTATLEPAPGQPLTDANFVRKNFTLPKNGGRLNIFLKNGRLQFSVHE